MAHGNTTHGKTGTKLYRVWKSIKRRCYKKTSTVYNNYGGRGITMQADWIKDFLKFEAYVMLLPGYKAGQLGNTGLSIDRIDNEGNYEENNLRWTTSIMQGRNRRLMSNNKTGYRGVSFQKQSNSYVSNVKVNKKQIYLGIRRTAKEAYQLRVDYIKKHNLIGFEV